MSLNDDDTALRCLPVLTESLEDKIHLFQCKRFALPMPNRSQAERALFESAIREELPAFADFLLKWVIPEPLSAVRFGVKHFHNPDLVAAIRSMSDEARLAELVEKAGLAVDDDGIWSGTAEELQNELFNNPRCGKQAASLLSWNNAVGTLLGRLAHQEPKKYTRKRMKRQGLRPRTWSIQLGFNA